MAYSVNGNCFLILNFFFWFFIFFKKNNSILIKIKTQIEIQTKQQIIDRLVVFDECVETEDVCFTKKKK